MEIGKQYNSDVNRQAGNLLQNTYIWGVLLFGAIGGEHKNPQITSPCNSVSSSVTQ